MDGEVEPVGTAGQTGILRMATRSDLRYRPGIHLTGIFNSTMVLVAIPNL